ncbi:uncharacterized protein Z518_06660 [Rhinocladiella mackenziei CBS 650.93]|uniref:Rhinocladiella mackenziei CBS 650.93 unplaced genomic scaffold supercont1.5, whole genome shotgun sequence n=1 Tax=Rhinocladiella mackenziei CBS 650.93 TaxID=1442369 RepID=A0A0D2J2H3_9EURO|nr:uncharacterized protein Z518_06660 [Rhinocladiella mackenziei CBS 650.93]KIX03110.1 hypothetical protein Z518_06660 [Rhinocladiella mackenziei CBS 650.93]
MAQTNPSPVEETGVIICGGGPTGVVLSALLGALKVPNIVLEKEKDITTDPRGIALDEDGIRILQSIGIYDKIYTQIGSCMEIFNFVTGTGSDLYKKPMVAMHYKTTEGGTGHVGFICHKQPAMEKAIRDQIEKTPLSEIRTECTVTGVSEDCDMAYVEYTNSRGETKRLKAPFLVGADGKTGYVRKRYLEPKGIVMERCKESTYEETWVALNWHISLPTEKTHPNFPLWRLGYTPQDVYDLFFPKEFRFLCNPKRPSVCGRFGLPSDRLWRFEFVVQKDEDGHKMATPEETRKIIYPYLTHPGSRYGVDYPVRYPEDCIKTLRSRPFSFVARSCNKWALGRVVLAGDAAHVFPPFGGQGIASGFRDASALAWRLALLHRNPILNHENILTAWYMERKQQLERSLAATITNGEYVTESDPIKVFIRDWYMWAIQLIPSWRREIQKGARAEGMTRYRHSKGMPFVPEMGGGLLLPQVYAYTFKTNRVSFTDDLIFSVDKTGLFQLLILPDSLDDIGAFTDGLKDIDAISHNLLRSDEATVLVQSSKTSSLLAHRNKAARIATAEEFAADPVLCKNRPPPIGYDERRIRKEVQGKKFLILRHDRFVFAACNTLSELKDAARRLVTALEM